MTQWRCSICGYTLTEETPPEVCPMCNNHCSFVDNTCYIPDCGKVESDSQG
ncbi:MAG TPA: hypothetical protein GXX34_12170 [Clostridia bacterium]|nr:hypothetical protein [Clostridia bacterium]